MNGGQGGNEVRWRPGKEASLAPQCSNLRYFGSKCAVLNKVVVTLLGLFRAPVVIRPPHSDLAPGELYPPRYALAGYGSTKCATRRGSSSNSHLEVQRRQCSIKIWFGAD